MGVNVRLELHLCVFLRSSSRFMSAFDAVLCLNKSKGGLATIASRSNITYLRSWVNVLFNVLALRGSFHAVKTNANGAHDEHGDCTRSANLLP